MSKRNYFGPLLLCVLGAMMAAGLYRIFRIRLVSGDLYPAWSSLRPEPDCAKVLFDALADTGRFEMVRKYKGLRESPERNATVLFLGYSPAQLVDASGAELEEFERGASAGNRILLAMDPGSWFRAPEQ